MKSLYFKTVQDVVNEIKNNPTLGYVFHVPISIIHELASHTNDNIVLVSTSGEYSSNGYENGAISGFSYKKEISEIIEIKNPPVLSKFDLEVGYNKVKNNKNAFMLLFLDGLSNDEEMVMTTFYFMKDDFKILGGSSGDNLKFEETVIFIGKKKVCHVAIYFDMNSKTQLLKENLYVPMSDKILITDADPINRIVKKINNQPAATEYSRLLGISESDLPNHFMNNPLGKLYQDDILIASPQKVNPDKSITFYCQIMPNTFVYLLQPVDPIEKLGETMKRIDFRPSFMYVINCILRSLKFQNENRWKQVDSCILGVCKNTTGFISYGEQFYKHHVNQTMVVLAVE
ncbi:MAG: hypothetical protein CVU98_11560 [Firmicutes bacterium HGW-Firmicutes-3]|nr:MAG: hypothetical protein CVU98_11560 [Firmicutes bacterium HGW-Firmicutes-3]